MSAAPGIEVEQLVVEHPTAWGPLVAVDHVTMAIQGGSVVGIMGPSGCGKSTLLGVMAGLASPTSGGVKIGSTEITGLSETARTEFRTRTVGVVYQADNLLPFLTVSENVQLQLALARVGTSDDEAFQRTEDVLEQLGVAALASRLPEQLSGGQRQRVAVARAIVHGPAVILADEPTGALDEANADVVVDLLVEAHRDLGATLVIVTHDHAIAARMDRVVHLVDGALAVERERPR